MADIGLSIGGIGGIGGIASGAGIGPGAHGVAPAQPAVSATITLGDAGHGERPDVVVTISDSGRHALTLDTGRVGLAGSVSRLADDLAALALLELLQREHRNDGNLASIASALQLYLAVQALR